MSADTAVFTSCMSAQQTADHQEHNHSCCGTAKDSSEFSIEGHSTAHPYSGSPNEITIADILRSQANRTIAQLHLMSRAMRAKWKFILGTCPFLAAAAARAALEHSASALYWALHWPGDSSKFSRFKHISSEATCTVHLSPPLYCLANLRASTLSFGFGRLAPPIACPQQKILVLRPQAYALYAAGQSLHEPERPSQLPTKLAWCIDNTRLPPERNVNKHSLKHSCRAESGGIPHAPFQPCLWSRLCLSIDPRMLSNERQDAQDGCN